jgi:hypothetical protein
MRAEAAAGLYGWAAQRAPIHDDSPQRCGDTRCGQVPLGVIPRCTVTRFANLFALQTRCACLLLESLSLSLSLSLSVLAGLTRCRSSPMAAAGAPISNDGLASYSIFAVFLPSTRGVLLIRIYLKKKKLPGATGPALACRQKKK